MWVSTATSPRTILQSGGRARLQCGHVFSLKDIDDMRMRFFTEGNHPQCPCCYRFSFPWKPRPGKVITSLVDNHLVRSDMDTTNPRSSRTKKGNCGKKKYAIEARSLLPPPWHEQKPFEPMRPSSGTEKADMPLSWRRSRQLLDTACYDGHDDISSSVDWTSGLTEELAGSTMQTSQRELPSVMLKILSVALESNATPPYPPMSFNDASPDQRIAWMMALGFTRAISDDATRVTSAYFRAQDTWSIAARSVTQYVRELSRRRRVESLCLKAGAIWRRIARYLPGTDELPTEPTILDVLTRATWSAGKKRISRVRKALVELCHNCVPFVEETMIFLDPITRQYMGQACKLWWKTVNFHDHLPPAIDLCFVVDCSQVMGNHMQETKAAMRMILKSIRGHHKAMELRVGVVAFRDYPCAPIEKAQKPANNYIERVPSISDPYQADGRERRLLDAVENGWDDAQSGETSYVIDLNGGLRISPDVAWKTIENIEAGPCSGTASSRAKGLALALHALHAESPPLETLELLQRTEVGKEDQGIQAMAKKCLLADFTPAWRAEIAQLLPPDMWGTISWSERWKLCYEELTTHIEWKNESRIMWRKFASKLVVVFSGTAPHGVELPPPESPREVVTEASRSRTATKTDETLRTHLDSCRFDSYETGDPLGADPLHSAHILQKMGVNCWTIVCPSAIDEDRKYAVPFLVGLAHRTGASSLPLKSAEFFSELIAISVAEHREVANIHREAEIELSRLSVGVSGYGSMRDHARAVSSARIVHQALAERELLKLRRARLEGTLEETVASEIFKVAPNIAWARQRVVEMEAEASVRTQTPRIVAYARRNVDWKQLTWAERKRQCEDSEELLALEDGITAAATRDRAKHTGGDLDKSQIEEIDVFEEERRRLARDLRRRNIVERHNELLAVQLVQSIARKLLARARYAIRLRERKDFHHQEKDVLHPSPLSVKFTDVLVSEKEIMEMLYSARNSAVSQGRRAHGTHA